MPDLLPSTVAKPETPPVAPVPATVAPAPAMPSGLTQPEPRKKRGLLLGIITAAVLATAVAAALLVAPIRDAAYSFAAPIAKRFEKEPATEPVPPPEPTPRDRDLERYGKVSSLRMALTSFESDNGTYPENLQELLPKYLTEMPDDPSTGRPYQYVNSSLGYTLSFDLEDGVICMSRGVHILTHQGFDAPLIETKTEVRPATTDVNDIPSAERPAENPLPPVSDAADADGDGLADAIEGDRGTDPSKPDSDGDGLDDGEEVDIYGTDPLKADTDGDGVVDGDEAYAGSDPKTADGRLPDADSDGLADVFETRHGYDPKDPDGDDDGLSDGDELRIFGTDPVRRDTDADGFADGDELRLGYDPTGSDRLSGDETKGFEEKGGTYGYHEPTTSTLRR
jgi:hypothetical protein